MKKLDKDQKAAVRELIKVYRKIDNGGPWELMDSMPILKELERKLGLDEVEE
jgi:hypothetical protein